MGTTDGREGGTLAGRSVDLYLEGTERKAPIPLSSCLLPRCSFTAPLLFFKIFLPSPLILLLNPPLIYVLRYGCFLENIWCCLLCECVLIYINCSGYRSHSPAYFFSLNSVFLRPTHLAVCKSCSMPPTNTESSRGTTGLLKVLTQTVLLGPQGSVPGLYRSGMVESWFVVLHFPKYCWVSSRTWCPHVVVDTWRYPVFLIFFSNLISIKWYYSVVLIGGRKMEFQKLKNT